MAGAMIISKKTARIGFEWKSEKDIWKKINEELKELKEAISLQKEKESEEELGDLLFTIVNIAR